MKKFIIGTKDKMVQFFTENGTCLPATLIDAGPVVVTQIKTIESDGYRAIQVGFGERRNKVIHNSVKGHTKEALEKVGMKDLGFAFIKEFRLTEGDKTEYAVGDKIDASIFDEGQKVQVTGTSKGKGFQGVVKRHGFHGGPRTHGQKHSEREPGSIGATGPQRVFKGTRMGGRMGSDRVMVKNLRVLAVDAKNNKMLIGGAIPGRRGTRVEIVEK